MSNIEQYKWMYNKYMKQCTSCKITKDLNKFSKSSTMKSGRLNQCNPCRYKKKLENNPGLRAKQREWNLKRDYGITVEEYDAVHKKQNGLCAICKKESNHKSGKLFVDHNHVTGNIRGLLCNPCNLLLGHSNDDISILKEAIKYLNKYKTV